MEPGIRRERVEGGGHRDVPEVALHRTDTDHRTALPGQLAKRAAGGEEG